MIVKCSVFIGHGPVQHAGAGWKGEQAISYQTYFIPEVGDLQDAVPFAYGDSLQPKGRKIRQFLDVQEDSSPDPITYVVLVGGKEVGEKGGEPSDGGSADKVPGD